MWDCTTVENSVQNIQHNFSSMWCSILLNELLVTHRQLSCRKLQHDVILQHFQILIWVDSFIGAKGSNETILDRASIQALFPHAFFSCELICTFCCPTCTMLVHYLILMKISFVWEPHVMLFSISACIAYIVNWSLLCVSCMIFHASVAYCTETYSNEV